MTNSETSPKRLYFPALTGVRAIAAYLVFIHHFGLEFRAPWVRFLSREMHIGVTVFFVLSGFLIYYAYQHKTINKTFALSYFRNRVARVYPVYFVIVLIMSLVTFYDGESLRTVIGHFILQVTFIRGFSDAYVFIGIGQGWSLTVEETFYFMFPLFLLGFRRGGFWRYLGLTYLMGLILLSIGTWIDFRGFFTPTRFMILYTFWGRAAEFFFGMFLARYLIQSSPSRHDIVKQGGAVRTWVGIAGIVACLVLMAQIGVWSNAFFGLYTPYGMLINNLLLPIFIVLLFWGLIVEQTVIRSFLAHPLIELLGRSSYVFYLIHLVPLQTVFFPFIETQFNFASEINVAIYFIVVNLLSIAIYLGFEEPLNKLIRRIKVGDERRTATR